MPKRFDPRLILLLNHTLLLSLGVTLYNVNRTTLQIVLGLGAAVVTEIVCAKLFDKEVDRIWSRVLSAVIAGLGFLLLTYSQLIWYYPLGSVIAVLSKYLIRSTPDRHIYNPTGFAIVFAFAFFPGYQPVFYTDTYQLSVYPTLQVLTLGSLVVILSNRWLLSLTSFLVLFVGGLLTEAFGRQEFWNVIGPEFGVVGLLLVFFMITDPKSSPNSHKGQVFAGVSYGLWNLFFKLNFVYAGNFLALFITATSVPVVRHLAKSYLKRSGSFA